jgi:hypothetical protein
LAAILRLPSVHLAAPASTTRQIKAAMVIQTISIRFIALSSKDHQKRHGLGPRKIFVTETVASKKK